MVQVSGAAMRKGYALQFENGHAFLIQERSVGILRTSGNGTIPFS